MNSALPQSISRIGFAGSGAPARAYWITLRVKSQMSRRTRPPRPPAMLVLRRHDCVPADAGTAANAAMSSAATRNSPPRLNTLSAMSSPVFGGPRARFLCRSVTKPSPLRVNPYPGRQPRCQSSFRRIHRIGGVTPGDTIRAVFDLTDEQREIQRLARDFADGEVRPIAEEIDREKRFPIEVIRKAGELGLMGIPYSEEYGGGGAGTLATRWRSRSSRASTPRPRSRSPPTPRSAPIRSTRSATTSRRSASCPTSPRAASSGRSGSPSPRLAATPATCAPPRSSRTATGGSTARSSSSPTRAPRSPAA